MYFPFLHARQQPGFAQRAASHLRIDGGRQTPSTFRVAASATRSCFNYVHHVVFRDHHGALRTDDWTRGSRWHHNVVRHSTYAGFVLKHDNTVEDNLFIDSSAPLIGCLVVRAGSLRPLIGPA